MMQMLKLIVVLSFAINLSACQTMSQIKEDILGDTRKEEKSGESGLVNTRVSQAGLQVKITEITNTSDGWLKYKLTLKNDTLAPVNDLRCVVVDVNGDSHNAAIDPFQLEELPSGVDQTLLLGGAAVGGTALAFAGFPFIGPLVAGGIILYNLNEAEKWSGNAQDFTRESLVGQSMPMNEQLTGSFFLPAVEPEKIKIGYLKGKRRHWLILDNRYNDNVQVTSSAGYSDMSDVQRQLTKLGYTPGPIDGMYGPKTAEAISKFQSDYNIQITGLPDKITRNKLNTLE